MVLGATVYQQAGNHDMFCTSVLLDDLFNGSGGDGLPTSWQP